MNDLGRCQQFYLCENAHPILGDVPACQRCADKLETIRKAVQGNGQ